MRFREKPLVLKAAQIIAASNPVTQAEQHPLVPQAEHVRAGDVFIARHIQGGHPAVKQVAEILPVPQIRGPHQVRILSAGDRVVGLSVEPAVGIPVSHLRKCSRPDSGVHRHRLRPAFQQIVLGKRDLITAGALAVIDDRRPASLGQKAGAAEQTVPHGGGGKRGRMPFPMDHVRAGYMRP